MIQTNRRSLITGLIALVAAPAIVRVASIMPVRSMLPQAEPVLYGVVMVISKTVVGHGGLLRVETEWQKIDSVRRVIAKWSTWQDYETSYEVGDIIVVGAGWKQHNVG